MQPLLRAENITKTYRTGDVDVEALKGVSFSIENGELIVVLGPSGSGKSTMLNILGGIETASSGGIYYEGSPLDWTRRGALTECLCNIKKHIIIHKIVSFAIPLLRTRMTKKRL